MNMNEEDEMEDLGGDEGEEGEVGEESHYRTSYPYENNPRMLRELLGNSTHIISMMGSMQRDMVENTARLTDLITWVSNLEVALTAQSRDIQELI